jgi:pimeloyl-ACP methyl ester carboxylesterase
LTAGVREVKGRADKPAKPVVHWLGGWVSSFECWEPQLRALYPEFEHRFMDTHTLLDVETPDFGHSGAHGGDGPHIGAAVQPCIVAAWSLGSLRAHKWMAEGTWPKDLPLLSLCPVFRFVQPESPSSFGESVLLRMEKKLGSAREAVLLDFWRRMSKAAEMPPEWESRWIEASRRHDDASVLRALQYLRIETADASELKSTPDRWELIAGEADRLAPVGAWKDALPPHARLGVHPGGHLPFWERPDLVRDSLRRLSGSGDSS